MKIGDMVVRAYAYHAFIPGIIVDEQTVTYPDDEISDEPPVHNFIVAWSDGNTSHEMDIELDYFDDALESMQECEIYYPEGRQ